MPALLDSRGHLRLSLVLLTPIGDVLREAKCTSWRGSASAGRWSWCSLPFNVCAVFALAHLTLFALCPSAFVEPPATCQMDQLVAKHWRRGR